MLPRLGTESEIVPTVLAISRLLKAEGLDWNDVATTLSDFVTNVAGADDSTLPPPASPKDIDDEPDEFGFTYGPAKQTAWSSVGAAPQRPTPPPRQPHQQGFYASQPGAAPPNPGPRRGQIDPRAWGAIADKKSLVEELIRKQLWTSAKEQDALNSMLLVLDSGFDIKRNQQRTLEHISTRL